jgi:hypothetical protein
MEVVIAFYPSAIFVVYFSFDITWPHRLVYTLSNHRLNALLVKDAPCSLKLVPTLEFRSFAHTLERGLLIAALAFIVFGVANRPGSSMRAAHGSISRIAMLSARAAATSRLPVTVVSRD